MVSLLLSSCASPLGTTSQPLGLVVITAGGAAIDDGATDVPTTLDLKVSAGRPLGSDEVTASLDGNRLATKTAGNSASASTRPMQLASHHQLKVEIDGDDHEIAFQVIGLTNVAAAEHLDPSATVLADIAFQHPPDHNAVAMNIPGGSWTDAKHLRIAWPQSAVPNQIALPATLPIDGGSHLVSAFSMPLTPTPRAGTLRRAVAEPVGVSPQPVLAFVVATAASHASAQANASHISELAPTGWRLEATGLSGSPDATTVSAGASAGTPVWPLIQNDPAQADPLGQALSDSSARSRLVEQVAAAAVAGGYPGVNLDIEALNATSRDDYTQFVDELTSRLHAKGIKIVVDIVGHRPGHLTEFSAMFDATKLRAITDATVLMAYDEHTEADGPGAVAGLDWDRELIAGTFGGGALSNVWLGLPLYARVWSGAGVNSTSYADAVATALGQPGAVVDYDFGAQTPYIRVNSTLTFFDDSDSLARKAAIAKDRGMAGLAVWRLGFEDPSFWTLALARDAVS